MNTEPYMRRIGRHLFHEHEASPVLYYPGAGVDTEPFTLFCEHGGIPVFLYCDYLLPQAEARKFMQQLPGCTVQDMGALAPGDLGAENWAAFWPGDATSKQFANPSTAYALWASLVSETGRRVFFGYFGTEGAQTLHRLRACGIEPAVAVAQDHGFGCNWTTFGGGDSPLLTAALGALPRFLYVGQNTDPWPGYEQVTAFCRRPGAMHAHPRALFARCPPQTHDCPAPESSADSTVTHHARLRDLIARSLRMEPVYEDTAHCH
jgi:hypothetical protein